jgi:hypothetical protein
MAVLAHKTWLTSATMALTLSAPPPVAPVFQMQHLDHGAAHLSCFHVLYKDPFLALLLW